MSLVDLRPKKCDKAIPEIEGTWKSVSDGCKNLKNV